MSHSAEAKIELENILKQNKCYITLPRIVVFSALLNSTAPLSVGEIVKKAESQISRASVYRALAVLEKLDIVRKVSISFKDRYELGDMFSRHHHHLTCESCGRIVPIKLGSKFESSMHSFGKRHGFKITSHEVELRGLCQSCS